jgi:hypothetical protein
VAALFPMMSEEELDDLAADSKANGLIHAVVVDADGQVIDGRNRLEACRRAGVDPRDELLNGADPRRYILSQNAARRHMSKGQLALVIIQTDGLSGNGELSYRSDLASQYGVSHQQGATRARDCASGSRRGYCRFRQCDRLVTD